MNPRSDERFPLTNGFRDNIEQPLYGPHTYSDNLPLYDRYVDDDELLSDLGDKPMSSPALRPTFDKY
jgi:hypothetical protein